MKISNKGFVITSYKNLLILVSGGLTELKRGLAFKIKDYKSIHDYYSKVIMDNYFYSFLNYLLYSLNRTPTKRFIKKKDPKQMKEIQKIVPVRY